jgi:riboflavin kinase/FMN adenylyltransferase
MGRQLGYPTANLQLPDERKLIPSEGIYAVKANTSLKAVMSIGTRPTFNGTDLRLEVHIFDFHAEIYGERLRVEFVDFIRHNQKFTSIEALIAQMDKDSDKARQLL